MSASTLVFLSHDRAIRRMTLQRFTMYACIYVEMLQIAAAAIQEVDDSIGRAQ